MRAHIVFCDDIRQEVTGKFILVGVYSGDMAIAVLPEMKHQPVANLATYIEISDLPAGEHACVATVSFRSGDDVRVISTIEWDTVVDFPELPAIISPTGLKFSTDKSGVLEIVVKREGHDEEILAGKLNISLRPVDEAPEFLPQQSN